MKKALTVLTALMIALLPAIAAGGEETELTILFTSDIHSNWQPHQTQIDGQTARLGGFARLKTAVDLSAVAGKTLLVDSGDFTMGTMYQVFAEKDAMELTLMGQIGYDAIALGNHDFELGEDGLKNELTVFANSDVSCPLLCANLTVKGEKRGENPLANEGVKDYLVLERGGVRIGLFALMGYEAIEYTPVTAFSFADPIETAKATVKTLRQDEKVDLIVLLAHCGTIPGAFAEDEQIAKAVPGIDVIVSGHAHKALTQEQRAGETIIVGAGTALTYLGKLTLRKTADGWDMTGYELLPLDESYPDDAAVAKRIAPYASALDRDYAAKYALETGVNDAFAVTNQDFLSADQMSENPNCEDYAYGRLIGDAYQSAIRELTGQTAQVIAEPLGVIRNGLYKGMLTITDLYNALSYGISPLDGSAGAPLMLCYLNGTELYDLCEVSASFSASLSGVQMLFGGLRYTYGADRLILNRVYEVEVRNPDTGLYERVARDKSKLYSVAASWSAMQNLKMISDTSKGLLSVVPKTAQGEPVDTDEELQDAILTYPSASGETLELKEWYAMYHYIASLPKNESGLHEIPDKYQSGGGYLVKGEGGFVNFFRNPSRAAWLMLVVLAVILLLIVLIVHFIRRGIRKRRAKKG